MQEEKKICSNKKSKKSKFLNRASNLIRLIQAKKYIYWWCYILIFLSNSACKHSRQLSQTVVNIPSTTVSTFAEIDSNSLFFSELSAKMKIDATLDGRKQSFNANMRWKKNHHIWISFNILGIEGMRVWIDKDSIRIIDRLNKRYIAKPYTYLNEVASIDIPFNQLENLLLGKLIMMVPETTTYYVENNQIVLNSGQNNYQYEAKLDSLHYLPSLITISNPLFGRNLKATFSDFRSIGDGFFSYKRSIIASDPLHNMILDATFEQVELQENLSYPFQVNSNYSREE